MMIAGGIREKLRIELVRRTRRTPSQSGVQLLKTCAAIGSAIALAGCFSTILTPRPDHSRFYLLTPTADAMSQPHASPASAGDFVLGLGPVKLPGYLDRPEVVVRAAPTRLELSRDDRWGESLQNSFTSVLSRDLGAQLGTQQILPYPWFNTAHVDMQVQVEVFRFETDAQGLATLSARWTVTNVADKTLLYSAESNLTQPSKPGDATEAAAALSRTVGDLSREIANMVSQLRTHRGVAHQ
jgi:uncharacterized lipoprotein YmbA